MEATMYDDNVTSPPNAKKRKIEMTLDLHGGKTKQEKVNELLTTPDVGMFMLTSPDLERFIIQQNGLVLTTPTPTQILFPKSVTEEQEAYARGFVEALGELHKNNGAGAAPSSGIGIINQATPIVSRGATSMSGMSGVPAPIAFVTLSNSGAGNPLVGGQPVNMIAQRLQQSQLPSVSRAPSSFPSMVKVESVPPQTVPTTLLPPADIRPIDMDEQEMAKLERKRARNRVAATRCRNRKLERIARLEERVAELKDQNSKLMESAAMLRDEVHRLKSGIIEHTRRGCQVMLTHNLL